MLRGESIDCRAADEGGLTCRLPLSNKSPSGSSARIARGGQLFSHLLQDLPASRKDLKLAPHKARDHLVRPSLLEEETGDRQNTPERVGFHTRQRNDADGNVDCDAAVGEAALSSRGSHETRARSCQLDTAKAAFLKTNCTEGAGNDVRNCGKGPLRPGRHRNVVSPCEISTYSCREAALPCREAVFPRQE